MSLSRLEKNISNTDAEFSKLSAITVNSFYQTLNHYEHLNVEGLAHIDFPIPENITFKTAAGNIYKIIELKDFLIVLS